MHGMAIRVSAASYAQRYKLMVDTACRVLEMQIIILALLENFELTPPPQTEKTKVHRRPTQIMLPMADGQKGVWMGLLVKPVN
jgi:hypothetical protein